LGLFRGTFLAAASTRESRLPRVFRPELALGARWAERDGLGLILWLLAPEERTPAAPS